MGSRFTIRAEHPAYARKIVRSTLTGASSQAVDTAALLTSVLVTNAMTRTEADPQLFLDAREGHIYVEVRDSVATPNGPPLPVEPARPQGMGLAIVDALATSWGTESRGEGEAVWFDLKFSPAPT